MVEINRIGGFPHSEIVGSKLAHSSPTLIAACHVLHRLYMPRHPRIALTSRLRVHTTNDNAGRPFGHQLGRAAYRGIFGADDFNLSQINFVTVKLERFEPPDRIVPSRSPSRTAEAILVVPNQYRHGIDFKNPFTMSKRVVIDPKTTASPRWNRFSSSLESLASALRLRAVSRSQAAPCGALRGAGRAWKNAIHLRASSFFLRIGGAYRDRTDDLMLAKQPLSQLS